ALVPLGPHRLLGLRDAEDVYALAAPGVHSPPPATDCPYPGLLAFSPDGADRFFGREEVVADIAARLGRHPFLAVVGGSGSGKSSVLRAGVVPALAGASVITPGPDPLSVLAAAHGPLVVDQFEELFTQCDDEDERGEFVERVLHWPNPVAVGLRADFYGACATYPALAVAVA